MGLSKPCSEQRKKELRIFRRVLIGAVLTALGVHISSVPLIVRYAASLIGDLELASEPPELVEVILLEEPETLPEPETEVSPPPTNEAAVDNEPAAAAETSAPPPLEASETTIATSPTSTSTTAAPPQAAVASESGVPDGAGAEGESDVVGLISGSGGLEIYDGPLKPPNVRVTQRDSVPAIASVDNIQRRRGGARTIACNPCTLPDYPESQRLRGREGFPEINIQFGRDGRVIAAEIETSSGNTAFDEATLQEALENWRFEDPRGLGGQVSVNVAFVIEGSEQYEAAQAAGVRESVELPIRSSEASNNASPSAPTGTASAVIGSSGHPNRSSESAAVPTRASAASTVATVVEADTPSSITPTSSQAANLGPEVVPAPSGESAVSRPATAAPSAPVASTMKPKSVARPPLAIAAPPTPVPEAPVSVPVPERTVSEE